MTPIKRIRKYCLWCCNNSKKEVFYCTSNNCSLWIYRLGKRLQKGLSSIKSIKARCIDCKLSAIKVRECKEKECWLYFYRNGKNPKRKGKGGNKNLHLYKKMTVE